MKFVRKNVSKLEKTCCQTCLDSLLCALMHRFWCAGANCICPLGIENELTKNLYNRRRNMKIEKWTVGLAAAGLVSLSPSLVAQTTNAAPQIIPMQTAL